MHVLWVGKAILWELSLETSFAVPGKKHNVHEARTIACLLANWIFILFPQVIIYLQCFIVGAGTQLPHNLWGRGKHTGQKSVDTDDHDSVSVQIVNDKPRKRLHQVANDLLEACCEEFEKVSATSTIWTHLQHTRINRMRLHRFNRSICFTNQHPRQFLHC